VPDFDSKPTYIDIIKGDKLEIFGSWVFFYTDQNCTCLPTYIRVGDAGARPKKLCFWLENRHFVFLSAVGDSAKNVPVTDSAKKMFNTVGDSV
jgi:hypothetical protein